MRIITNKNISATVVSELRVHGHDVLAVKESMRGEKDDAILARAHAESRIVLTHDKDFGELAFRFGLVANCDLILVRLSGSDRDSDNQRVVKAIQSRSDWEGHFSVVEQHRIRSRPLSTSPADAPDSDD